MNTEKNEIDWQARWLELKRQIQMDLALTSVPARMPIYERVLKRMELLEDANPAQKKGDEA